MLSVFTDRNYRVAVNIACRRFESRLALEPTVPAFTRLTVPAIPRPTVPAVPGFLELPQVVGEATEVG